MWSSVRLNDSWIAQGGRAVSQSLKCADCGKEYRSRSSLKKWWTGKEEWDTEHILLCMHCFEGRRNRQDLANLHQLAEACRAANSRADIAEEAAENYWEAWQDAAIYWKDKLAEARAAAREFYQSELLLMPDTEQGDRLHAEWIRKYPWLKGESNG